MIEALYQIGKIQEQNSFLEEYIEDIGKGYKHIFRIMLDISDPEEGLPQDLKPEYN